MFASKSQRIERSANEVERLRVECLDWVALRHKQDTNQQYKTQLDALGELVERACAAIKQALPQANDTLAVDATFEQCRFLDSRIAWTRRLWEFFREKFDQRDGPYAAVLKAADEVIWSCYRTPFKTLEQAGGPRPGASPLPYIEPYLSPAAYPREIFPPGLTAEDKAFRRQFNQLPIPLVRLSPLCLKEPWWLIFIAHEAGHQVQYDLELVDEFKLALEEAIEASPNATPERAARWSAWSREIFADIYSVGAAGVPATLAMADAEYGLKEHLLDRELEGYPAPLVRLSLLDETAQHFGFARPLQETLQSLKAAVGPLPPEIAADLELVPVIIQTAFDKLQPEGLSLPELIPPYPNLYAPGGKLSFWVEQLRYGPDPIIERNLDSARLLSAAAYQAWSDSLTAASPDPAAQQDLASRTLQSLQQSREAGTRGSSQTRLDPGLLSDIAALLISPQTQLPPSLQIQP